MNKEIELIILLRHPNPATDPEGFINSLPDSVVKSFYMLDKNPGTQVPLTLEEKRSNAISFFKRMNNTTVAIDSLRHIFIQLEKHYSENV